MQSHAPLPQNNPTSRPHPDEERFKKPANGQSTVTAVAPDPDPAAAAAVAGRNSRARTSAGKSMSQQLAASEGRLASASDQYTMMLFSESRPDVERAPVTSPYFLNKPSGKSLVANNRWEWLTGVRRVAQATLIQINSIRIPDILRAFLLLRLDLRNDDLHAVGRRGPPLEDQLVPEHAVAVQPDLRIQRHAPNRLDHHVGHYSGPNEGQGSNDQADERSDKGGLGNPNLLRIPRGRSVLKPGESHDDRRDCGDPDRDQRCDIGADRHQLFQLALTSEIDLEIKEYNANFQKFPQEGHSRERKALIIKLRQKD